MEYQKTVLLKHGRTCILRNGTARDAQAALDNFVLTHTQTDYLLTYPDESSLTVEQEAQYLAEKTESDSEIEILAEIDGMVVGAAGIERVGTQSKVRHRAEFGISVDRAYWGLGIGRALMKACIACARIAGYVVLELNVVAENTPALALYHSEGFVEYGRHPKGFLSRTDGWQELVLMQLDLT